jgi:type I restriction enzyme S subunit
MLDEPMIIAGYIIRLRMNGKACPEYLSTFLNLDSSKKMLMAMAKGAVGQANINAKEVQAIEIVIPPIEVQQQFCHLIHQSDKSKIELQKVLDELTAMQKKIIEQSLT